MNAVTKTETIALETAAPLEVADPTKNLILVPLSQLSPRRSKHNVRTTARQSIPKLAPQQRVAGIYRRSVTLPSGRYAMLDDGMGFSLVPWTPVST
jgi:ParB family chromosome partitioning protein